MLGTLYTSYIMNTSNDNRKSKSEVKFSQISARNALPVVLLIFVSVLLQPAASNDAQFTIKNLVWAIVSMLAVAGLLWTFISGYKRSDERQRLIQLKAAAITCVLFVLGLSGANVIGGLGLYTGQDLSGLVFSSVLFLWLLIVLPGVAKRANEE